MLKNVVSTGLNRPLESKINCFKEAICLLSYFKFLYIFIKMKIIINMHKIITVQRLCHALANHFPYAFVKPKFSVL